MLDIGYSLLQDGPNTQYPIPNIDYLATKDLAAFVKFLVVENEPCQNTLYALLQNGALKAPEMLIFRKTVATKKCWRQKRAPRDIYCHLSELGILI